MQMFGDGNGVKRGRGVHMDVKRIYDCLIEYVLRIGDRLPSNLVRMLLSLRRLLCSIDW